MKFSKFMPRFKVIFNYKQNICWFEDKLSNNLDIIQHSVHIYERSYIFLLKESRNQWKES